MEGLSYSDAFVECTSLEVFFKNIFIQNTIKNV